MAKFTFNDGTKFGGLARTTLNLMESGDEQSDHLHGSLAAAITGQGNQDADFDGIKTLMGFATDTEARTWWTEFDTAYQASSGARAARLQFYNESR